MLKMLNEAFHSLISLPFSNLEEALSLEKGGERVGESVRLELFSWEGLVKE